MNKQLKFTTESPEETMKLGEQLARCLKAGDIVCLMGDLGTGKTTLVKGMAKGLRIKQSSVNSPSYVLLNMYEGKLPVFHFDLYRLDGTQDINAIGYDEFLYSGDGVSVIEWAERLKSLLPREYLKVQLAHKNKNDCREIIISASGEGYFGVIEKIRS